ncbi:hypothetical protein PYK79_11100 [Streptomyces sp. ID05-04B]|uniref:hypothetical protein n=1 Tax=unclassified Streptomyces TaxID=2593676 RepID=UPI000D1A48D4|nr:MULTISPECIES: hypothetical protein [unclassified Streptomyces]AVV46474.1 hypothetical protein C6376_39060 [Streptomyces sp. P3]AVV46835.1 hypothetical protein C6376_41465 [Streptomyces sp. P3]MDX5563801.1 hypothetical protein [Streptomyces sp. ID05-04B]
MPSNLFVSMMRTLVPIVAALVISWTGRLGIPVDSNAAASAVALGLAAAYYLLFRGLEWLAARLSWAPLQRAAGVFLGWAQPPAYGGKDDDLRAALQRAQGGDRSSGS